MIASKQSDQQDIGFTIRFRQRVAREWFFTEYSAGVSWPREFLIEERESNIGVGVSFEMRFGQWKQHPNSTD